MSKEKFSLKDQLFNPSKVSSLAFEIQAAYPTFKTEDFIATITQELPKLELKERISHIAEGLRNYLPAEYDQAIKVIVSALPKPLDPNLTDNDFGDFIYAPYGYFIAKYGCTKERLLLSFSALSEITMRFSVEDPMRYFINAFPVETLNQLETWSQHSNYHVKRLVSECTRPKLPWSKSISYAVETPVFLLDRLFCDSTRFVTRSVANHVNDISKTHPDLVIILLNRWRDSGKQVEKELRFIERHALRTLLKKGNKKALNYLGFSENPSISISEFSYKYEVNLDSAFHFSFKLKALASSNLMIDFVIHFRANNGDVSRKKVFKLKEVQLSNGESIYLSKKTPMRSDMTTRKLYLGEQKFEIQINGKIVTEAFFNIV